MFWLFTREITPQGIGGLIGLLLFFILGRRLDRDRFRFSQGRWFLHFLGMMVFILLQVVCWRYVYFFRDPERIVPEQPAIVSPADGYVVYVRQIESGSIPLAIKKEKNIPLKEIIKTDHDMQEGIHIGIFMTPMSVHVNRSPISGIIESRAYFKGTQMHSMFPMAFRTILMKKPLETGANHILRNERETLLIRGEFPVYLTRIADPYIDKIVTWKENGERLEQGERLGLIKMGSQADIVFPRRVKNKNIRVQVQEGDYVYAGETILATIEKK